MAHIKDMAKKWTCGLWDAFYLYCMFLASVKSLANVITDCLEDHRSTTLRMWVCGTRYDTGDTALKGKGGPM